jgi:hypothetical protein
MTAATPTRRLTVPLPQPLLDDMRRHWPGWTASDVVCHGLMLALAWHEHGYDQESA